jgi:hypothetical protein
MKNADPEIPTVPTNSDDGRATGTTVKVADGTNESRVLAKPDHRCFTAESVKSGLFAKEDESPKADERKRSETP